MTQTNARPPRWPPETGAGRLPDGLVQVPEIRELGDGYAVFRTDRRELCLSPWIRQFIRTCAEMQVVPVLLTDPRAAASPVLRQALTLGGGNWVLQLDDHDYVDVASHRRFRDLDQLASPFLLLNNPAVQGFPGGEPPRSLLLELEIHHRADATAAVGRAAELCGEVLGVEPLLSFDVVEPSWREWSLEALKEFAQARMPDTPRIVFHGHDAWWLARYERTEEGVTEHLFGVLTTGEGQAADTESMTLAERAIAAVRDEANLVAGFAAEVHSFPRPVQAGWVRGDQRPLLLALGPLALKRGGLRADDLAAVGAQIGGRQKVPDALVRLSDENGVSMALADLAQRVGIESLLSALDMRWGES